MLQISAYHALTTCSCIADLQAAALATRALYVQYPVFLDYPAPQVACVYIHSTRTNLATRPLSCCRRHAGVWWVTAARSRTDSEPPSQPVDRPRPVVRRCARKQGLIRGVELHVTRAWYVCSTKHTTVWPTGSLAVEYVDLGRFATMLTRS